MAEEPRWETYPLLMKLVTGKTLAIQPLTPEIVITYHITITYMVTIYRIEICPGRATKLYKKAHKWLPIFDLR